MIGFQETYREMSKLTIILTIKKYTNIDTYISIINSYHCLNDIL